MNRVIVQCITYTWVITRGVKCIDQKINSIMDTTMYRDDNGWLNTHMNNMNSEVLI